MQKLLIATKNKGKYGEILNIVQDLPYDFVFLGDLNIDDSGFLEDGETFMENAYKKAKFFGDKTGFLTLGEDSGIVVEALKGELGVKTRRWGAGEHVSDQEWIDYFMKRMEHEQNRDARFVCSACLLNPMEDWHEIYEGETRGILSKELMAPILPGLPLSSCFMPEGMDKVYAALTPEQKASVSHRGQAISQIKKRLLPNRSQY